MVRVAAPSIGVLAVVGPLAIGCTSGHPRHPVGAEAAAPNAERWVLNAAASDSLAPELPASAPRSVRNAVRELMDNRPQQVVVQLDGTELRIDLHPETNVGRVMSLHCTQYAERFRLASGRLYLDHRLTCGQFQFEVVLVFEREYDGLDEPSAPLSPSAGWMSPK
ncbi:MAG: hypothetical protein OXG58_03735 [Gemmatimonadetes bacterium]|nr:hypothetical protein [Gemmatimonadota bacterium]MCY3942964.1 hypothetical protein [Gemmatimonadota bacterium]